VDSDSKQPASLPSQVEGELTCTQGCYNEMCATGLQRLASGSSLLIKYSWSIGEEVVLQGGERENPSSPIAGE